MRPLCRLVEGLGLDRHVPGGHVLEENFKATEPFGVDRNVVSIRRHQQFHVLRRW